MDGVTRKLGEAAEDIPEDALKIDIDGKVYLLHHSRTRLEVGEKILASGSPGLKQSTAGDAFAGFSYGWDARDPEAVTNAIRGGGFSNDNPSPHVYITVADESQIHPDLNVPNSLSRAVRGEQTILASISRLPNESVEDFSVRIRDKLGVLGRDLGVDLSPRTVEESALVNLRIDCIR